MAITSVSSRPRKRIGIAVSVVSPSVAMKLADTNEPIMKTSPWAKLMSSTMP